ncbi:hypothetical protein SAMN05216345_1354 [Cupriavidus sp. YR651]|uniref:hypothetical protein n=1 Tax=Cupriavidus sp. YR651 TaxID=1855315 RepID=UPI00088793E4|nr:hypothetical protein [Cupriavidus sp. YR651]SDE02673.1 hypothetical protein SAMN05216345_1354 [Cupriavidus sp. YR651]
MNTAVMQWHEISESDIPCWARDLDPNLYSVNHRRLCVWQDEFDGRWLWEVETFSGTGEGASGQATSLLEAQAEADRAVDRSIRDC